MKPRTTIAEINEWQRLWDEGHAKHFNEVLQACRALVSDIGPKATWKDVHNTKFTGSEDAGRVNFGQPHRMEDVMNDTQRPTTVVVNTDALDTEGKPCIAIAIDGHRFIVDEFKVDQASGTPRVTLVFATEAIVVKA